MSTNRTLLKIPFHKIIVFLVFIMMLIIMRIIEPDFLSYSGGGKTLDMRLGYTSGAAYGLFDTLGSEGISCYKRLLHIDFIFIISFALLQAYLLKWIMGRLVQKTRWKYLVLLSYLRGVFDITENILILISMGAFPSKSNLLLSISSLSTMLKFIMLGLWIASIPMLLVIRSNMKRRLNNEQNSYSL